MEYKINKASDDVIENVLLNRNLTFDMVDELLLSDEKNYESPHNYPNIDKAYRRIKKAIDEGKWYVDVAKEIGDDGKLGVHKSVLTSLEELGYNVFWANEKSMKTYRISWK